MKKEDLSVEATVGDLALSGERKHEKEGKKDVYRSERESGRFYRADVVTGRPDAELNPHPQWRQSTTVVTKALSLPPPDNPHGGWSPSDAM